MSMLPTVDTETRVRANETRLADVVGEAREELATGSARTHQLLIRLAAAVAAHSRADTSIGILDSVVFQSPRLAADVERLRREHRELPEIVAELGRRAADLEGDVAAVLSRLSQHQRLADHLVYEAFATDLGDGD